MSSTTAADASAVANGIPAAAAATVAVALTLAVERPNGTVVFSIALIVATLTSMARWCVEWLRLWRQSQAK